MSADEFTQHVARLRVRFASTLDGKIADCLAAVEHIAGAGETAVEAVVATHRRLHEMYGIAPTLDFPRTGKAAGQARAAIREAAKAKRAATPDEVAAFISALEDLRRAASEELQLFKNGETVDAR